MCLSSIIQHELTLSATSAVELSTMWLVTRDKASQTLGPRPSFAAPSIWKAAPATPHLQIVRPKSLRTRLADIPKVFRERPRFILRHKWHLLTRRERAVKDRRRRNQRARWNGRWLIDRGRFGDRNRANEQVPHILEVQVQLDHRSSGAWGCRTVESSRS